MGGGGARGPSYIPKVDDKNRKKLSVKIAELRKEEEQKIDQKINNYLQGLLQKYNDRDYDSTKEHIEALAEILGDTTELKQMLYGGSVAKHTYVDGLSDVDALAIIDRNEGVKILLPNFLKNFTTNLNLILVIRK